MSVQMSFIAEHSGGADMLSSRSISCASVMGIFIS